MCSLQEAFQTFSDVPNKDIKEKDIPGQEDPERKKKKKRRAMEAVIEPDRPAHRTLPPGELLGLTSNTKSTSISDMLNAVESAEYFPHPASESSDKNVYNLEPDWATAFNDTSAPSWIKDRLPSRSAEVPLIPSPWLDGAPTLWQKVPGSQATQFDLEGAEQKASNGLDELQRKFDAMFKKLEDLDNARADSHHLEIILFILGGIFLLLLLDLLVKQGTQAMVLLGRAGGGAISGFTTG